MSKPSRYTPSRACIPAAVCAIILLACGSASAGEALKLTDASFMEVDAQLKGAKGHSNEEWRIYGLKAYLSGHVDEAVKDFKHAAGYADKFSQHYLSLIYWHGQGVPQDRVQAYIWSDLAAERGGRRLLAIREKMWSQLTPEQRKQVEAGGQAYYDRYGDAIAKPRAEVEIRRFAKGMTGSRTGYNNQNIDIQMGGPIHGSFGGSPGMVAASMAVNGGTDETKMYHENRTRPDAYWRDQDEQLDERKGTVDVGPLQQAGKP